MPRYEVIAISNPPYNGKYVFDAASPVAALDRVRNLTFAGETGWKRVKEFSVKTDLQKWENSETGRSVLFLASAAIETFGSVRNEDEED